MDCKARGLTSLLTTVIDIGIHSKSIHLPFLVYFSDTHIVSVIDFHTKEKQLF